MAHRPVPSYPVLCVLIDEDKVSGFEHSRPKPVLYSHHHTDRSLLHCGPFRSITLFVTIAGLLEASPFDKGE